MGRFAGEGYEIYDINCEHEVKWHEYIWLPRLKPYEIQDIPVSDDGLRGGYTISNYTKYDCELSRKYYMRREFWEKFLIWRGK